MGDSLSLFSFHHKRMQGQYFSLVGKTMTAWKSCKFNTPGLPGRVVNSFDMLLELQRNCSFHTRKNSRPIHPLKTYTTKLQRCIMWLWHSRPPKSTPYLKVSFFPSSHVTIPGSLLLTVVPWISFSNVLLECYTCYVAWLSIYFAPRENSTRCTHRLL